MAVENFIHRKNTQAKKANESAMLDRNKLWYIVLRKRGVYERKKEVF